MPRKADGGAPSRGPAGLDREIARLVDSLEELSQPPGAVDAAALGEHLRIALEELQVSQEELQAINQELLSSRLAVEQERARYHELFEQAPDAYVVTDLQGHIREANQRAAEMFFAEARHLVDKPLVVFVSSSARREFRARLNELASGGPERLAFLTTLQGRQGPPVEVEATVSSARDSSGALVGLRWILRDLTEIEREREATRSSEQRLSTITATSTDGIVTVDDGGRIESFNAAAERMFGYAADEVVGEDVARLMPEPDRSAHSAYMARYLETGERHIIGSRREVMASRRDGSTFPIDLMVSELWVSGERRFTAIIRDLSDRRESQEALQRVDRMEVMARVASGIAHDFGNAMMGILGCSRAALRRLDRPAEAATYLEAIRDATQRAANLARQLVRSSHDRSVAPVPAEPDAVIGAVEPLLHQVVGENVALRLELGCERAHVGVDAVQLEQVLLNLVVNAGDAMPSGGTLTIQTSLVEAGDDGSPRRSALPGASWVRLAIVDTGRGMDAETRARVFEPYFTTKGEQGGFGLGLASVAALVGQAGGTVEIESEPGRGTAVFVFLPRVGRAPVPGPRRRRVAPADGGGTVLVVEDDYLVRMSTRDLLEDLGWTVLEAAEAVGALRLWEAHEGPIDLLLTDVVLPGMSGIDLALELRARRSDLPVVCMSAYGQPGLSRPGVGTATFPLLPKPFDERQLAEALAKCSVEAC